MSIHPTSQNTTKSCGADAKIPEASGGVTRESYFAIRLAGYYCFRHLNMMVSGMRQGQLCTVIRAALKEYMEEHQTLLQQWDRISSSSRTIRAVDQLSTTDGSTLRYESNESDEDEQ